jgi:exodeoxyribonuclease III
LVAGPFNIVALYVFTEPTLVRIVVWNCRMALEKKRQLLYALKPDIAVIPECSRASTLVCKDDGFDICWWGENKHKGLGVLAAKPWALELRLRPGQQPQQGHPYQILSRHKQLRQNRPRQKWIAPVWVYGPRNFLLLPVWACPVGTTREQNYVGQIYDAIVRHPRWFAEDLPTVICGDFNSNTIFDPGRKKKTHSSVVRLLDERGLTSAYHEFFSETHGAETKPTYYFWHREERSFHLDYIFVPREWMQRVVACEVGTFSQWRPASDHMPIVLDIAIDPIVPVLTAKDAKEHEEKLISKRPA